MLYSCRISSQRTKRSSGRWQATSAAAPATRRSSRRCGRRRRRLLPLSPPYTIRTVSVARLSEYTVQVTLCIIPGEVFPRMLFETLEAELLARFGGFTRQDGTLDP